MQDAILYITEQIKYFRVAFSLSSYSTKSSLMQNKLGRVWEILDPLVQLGLNYLIFEVLMHRSVVGYPALPWMFIGLGVYGFSKNVIVTGSKSVANQFKVSSKMKFPLSILPLSASLGFLNELYMMVGAGFLLAIFNGYLPSLYSLQIIYYFFALVMFSLSFSLLNSTILILFPDYKFFLNYAFRLLMYFSGVIFSLDQFRQIPVFIRQAQGINPFYYLIQGFRDSAFGTEFFWEKGIYNINFWAITILILMIASNMHMKIRDNISDYL